MYMDLMRASTRKKRDHVIQTAMQLFAEKGYENVSVDEIIAATGTSKGTFYHYFKSKDEIVAHVYEEQFRIIERWTHQTPGNVTSLERHVTRLFLDLASNIGQSRRFIRSLSALQVQNDTLGRQQQRLLNELKAALSRWIPEPDKIDLLNVAYWGTVVMWCAKEEETDLLQETEANLSLVWAGIRSEKAVHNKDGYVREEIKMRVAVIGGGLAGLTASAYLSENPAVEGIMFERSPQLGGRAFTYEKSGFTLNYGAHAVYGIDRHVLTDMEKELKLSFSSKEVDKSKVMYEKHDQITPAPLNAVNLLRTGILSAMEKVRFVGEIAAIIAQIHSIKNYKTLGDYLDQSDASEDVKELWEHLVCSNFFITPEDARKVSGAVISEYYHNLFLSQRPVNYILGSWAVITNQLQDKIMQSGRWSISVQEAVESVRYENKQYIVTTKKREEAFDKLIFAMPVQHTVKLLKGTPWEPFLADYENNTATEVMVYDIGLRRVVARPFSYISDMNNKLFITDVSATDNTLVADGGQLLQGVAYLSDESIIEESERKQYLEERQKQMEGLFDRHYPGWRDEVEVKRVSKKAMVQSVKNITTNKLLPVRVENVPFYFCGDGCEGKGELAERSFSSARNAAKRILKELPNA